MLPIVADPPSISLDVTSDEERITVLLEFPRLETVQRVYLVDSVVSNEIRNRPGLFSSDLIRGSTAKKPMVSRAHRSCLHTLAFPGGILLHPHRRLHTPSRTHLTLRHPRIEQREPHRGKPPVSQRTRRSFMEAPTTPTPAPHLRGRESRYSRPSFSGTKSPAKLLPLPMLDT